MKTYKTILSNLKDNQVLIEKSEYHDQSFGSWYIQTNSLPTYRIAHDGRDKTIALKIKRNGEWDCLLFDKTISGKHVLKKLLTELKEKREP